MSLGTVAICHKLAAGGLNALLWQGNQYEYSACLGSMAFLINL
jgi:hypothetical protein